MLKQVLIAAVLGVAASSQAAVVTLNAGDGFGTSSFSAAGNWSNAAAPSAGNDYIAGFVGGADRLLRTPVDANNYTFAGDSLTIAGSGLAASANNQALIWKGTTAAATPATITINNLILNGGQIRQGESEARGFILAGNILVNSTGGNMAAQGPMNVSANLAGTGTLRILDSGNTSAGRTIILSSPTNTFTGNIEMAATGGNSARSRLTLADNANLNFVIGANGVNNSLSGTGTVVLDGDFVIDLSAAALATGNTWNLVTASSRTFNSSFNVVGFTPDVGGTLWVRSFSGSTFTFNEGTGALTVLVPEPATLTALAAGSLLAIRRRK